MCCIYIWHYICCCIIIKITTTTHTFCCCCCCWYLYTMYWWCFTNIWCKEYKRMDYKGQELAENIYQIVILIFGVIGWIYGYVLNDLTHSFQVWCVGVAVACIIAIPSWPCFNRNPVKWLDEIPKRPQPKRKKKQKKNK